MWSLKFKVLNKDSIYTQLTCRIKVVDYLYPVDYFIKKGKINILAVHILEGEENEKKRFFKELKENRKVREFESEKSQAITLIAEEEHFYELLFAAELYHPSPVIIKNGYEEWHVCSFERKKLENVIEEIEKWKNKFPEFILQSLAQSKLDEIYFPKIRSQLPEKQKRAFSLALKRGYYRCPRKVDLGRLAKELGVSTSTFHENLRKAEEKLMPFFAG